MPYHMDAHVDSALVMLPANDCIYYRRKIMCYAASNPKHFMKAIEDAEPDVMLQLEKSSRVGKEPEDYMSESWDVWHNNCIAAIEHGLRNKPQFLAIIGGLPMQTITYILDAIDCNLTDIFSDMRVNTSS